MSKKDLRQFTLAVFFLFTAIGPLTLIDGIRQFTVTKELKDDATVVFASIL